MEAQRLPLLNFAKSSGFDDVVEYIDNGEIGFTLDAPALKQLTNDIYMGKFKKVFVIDATRIGKFGIGNPAVLEWIEKVNALGVEIISTDMGILNAQSCAQALHIKSVLFRNSLFADPDIDILLSIDLDSLDQSESINDAIRGWLNANGHRWDYDQDGQLRASIGGVWGYPNHVGNGDIEWLPIAPDNA